MVGQRTQGVESSGGGGPSIAERPAWRFKALMRIENGHQAAAVVGSIIRLISVIFVAGNPLISACR